MIPLLLLLNLPFNRSTTTLVRRTSNYADVRGAGLGGPVRRVVRT
jgi:hypothetical protein